MGSIEYPCGTSAVGPDPLPFQCPIHGADCHEHQFPEEQTSEGVRLLLPCLFCGLAAGDALIAVREQLAAARLPAPQSEPDIRAEVDVFCRKLLFVQRPLPPDVAKILSENLWELYETASDTDAFKASNLAAAPHGCPPEKETL